MKERYQLKSVAQQLHPSILNPQSSILNLFWLTMILTFIFRVYLSCLVPITADEAEYVYMGQHFALGYYDHPPMIAWLLYPMTLIGLNNIWLRFLAILVPNIIGYCLYKGLSIQDEKKAYFIAFLYLISPVSLFFIGILTDTPLMLFSFLAVFCLYFGAVKNHYRYYILAGIFIGAAFFSKYLMFPVAVSIALYFIFSHHLENRWRKFFLVILFALPFVIQNVWWNYHHDWVNVLFNVDLRNRYTDHLIWYKPVIYFLGLSAIFGPVLFWMILKNSLSFWRDKFKSPNSIWIITAFFTLVFYAFLSIIKKVGLHWTFCSYPFVFASLICVLDVNSLKQCSKYTLFYSVILLLTVLILFHLPLHVFKKHEHFYNRANFFLNYHDMEPQLKPYLEKGFILTTLSYGQSYLLAYRQRIDVAIFGKGSVHGRQDDLSSDFKTFNHKNILIMDLDYKLSAQNVSDYFHRIEIKTLKLHGMPYQIILGYDFNYPKYRDTVLKEIYDRYYQVPKWLPRSQPYYQNKYGL